MSNPFEIIDTRLSNIESLLLDLKHAPKDSTPNIEEDQLLTIKEAANLLKYSVPSMYRLISANKIPNLKKGGKILFSKEELITWAKEGRRKTVDEIAEDAEKHLGKLGNKKAAATNPKAN